MKIVADESVDKQIVDRLRANGHDVLFVAELAPGIDDETVLGRVGQALGLRRPLRPPCCAFNRLQWVFDRARARTGVLLHNSCRLD